MSYFEKEINKKYFNIGEVAQSLNVNTSLIRFWEEKFDILNPKKNKKGKRKYTKKDIKILNEIYNLVKEKGFTIKGANSIIKNKNNSINQNEILESLVKIKNSIENLRNRI
tara:strand:- start:740 stop:1072 length:333 start_codon:yes stop_codon:yes gene_type:complete